ncbi:aminotransferase, class III [Ostertagia ostertagi]
MQMSPYKFDHGSTLPQPEWVHVAPCPDVFRGEYRLADDELNNPEKLEKAGIHYSDAVNNLIEKAESNGRTVAAYFAEALQSCGGQVIPPPGYFTEVARHVRNHGGLVVIDEVQTGFGRVGSKFWAHQLFDDGFCPDIVTMGKPMGNGFPVSAVATTRKIADALGGKVGYFNTEIQWRVQQVLGVMRVIREEKLLEHSQEMGEEFERQLNQLKAKYQCIGDAESNGRTVAAYFAEALQSCGGQVIPPPGYFTEVARHVRNHGGLVVIDEVQTGFGRVGSKFWAHQLFDDGRLHRVNKSMYPSASELQIFRFLPDIVTMGKPMGNGFPVSAVATTRKIADALGGKVGYFNTYGGNPVACAAVLGVMRVIREEKLLEHSQEMGEEFERQLNQLKAKYQCIGDVRGVGLFWGIDLVKDRQTREPDQELALSLILKLRRDRGILLNADGPHVNILKIKPPLCFDKQNLMDTINALDRTLAEMGK